MLLWFNDCIELMVVGLSHWKQLSSHSSLMTNRERREKGKHTRRITKTNGQTWKETLFTLLFGEVVRQKTQTNRYSYLKPQITRKKIESLEKQVSWPQILPDAFKGGYRVGGVVWVAVALGVGHDNFICHLVLRETRIIRKEMFRWTIPLTTRW